MPNTNVIAAPWSTAQKNDLPDSSYAFIDASGGKHLPYKDANGKVDLNHVRNALARLNQVKGMSDADRTKVKAKLQGALKNAKGADDYIMRSFSAVNADDSSTLPIEVNLLHSGDYNTEKYGLVKLSASDVQEMADNFNNGLGMAHNGETGIPIDFAHQSHLNAAAWIKGMRVDKDEDDTAYLIGTNLEFSGTGRQAILNKEYKCISADFYPADFGEWVDAESGVTAKNVIVGAALTNRPMFTSLAPIVASEKSDDEGGSLTVIQIANEQKEREDMTIDKVQVKAANEVSGEEQRFLQEHYNELNADTRTKFGLVEPKVEASNTKTIKAAEITGTEGIVQVQAADLKAQNDKISGLEASVTELQAVKAANVKKEAERTVDEALSKGKIIASQKDAWVAKIVADESNTELLNSLPENKLIGNKQGANSSESSNLSPREEQVKKAKELMAADDKLDIQKAMNKVVAADPDLAQRIAHENKVLAGVA